MPPEPRFTTVKPTLSIFLLFTVRLGATVTLGFAAVTMCAASTALSVGLVLNFLAIDLGNIIVLNSGMLIAEQNLEVPGVKSWVS